MVIKNKKIILPGGAGLVGQNLVACLKRQGYCNLFVLDKHQANLEILRHMHPDITVEYAYLSNALSLLHRCYGHLPVSRLHKYFALRQAQGETVDMRIFRQLHKYVCTICMKSKATRGDHSGKIITDVTPGEVYGADVCGPFATASILGNTYMFCIIDYASKRIWCYFCKHKDQAFDFIKHFYSD